MSTSLPAKVSDWPVEWRELFEERAGIMEYVANLDRHAAEYWAERDIRKQKRESETGQGPVAHSQERNHAETSR